MAHHKMTNHKIFFHLGKVLPDASKMVLWVAFFFFFFAFSVKVSQYGMSGSCKREKKRIILEANVASVEINSFSFMLSTQKKEPLPTHYLGGSELAAEVGSFVWTSLQMTS